MAKPWGPGAWAAGVERADGEAESFPSLREAERAAVASGSGAESFPSLREAAAAGKPRKKNKGQTLTLSQLATGLYVGPGGRSRGGGAAAASASKGLTTEELMMLPTGPRERSAEESDYGGSGRLGGGFRDYGRKEGGGGGASGGGGGFRDEGDGQWGSNRRPFGGGFQDDRRPQIRVTDFEPSRADEVDNWATAKKVAPPTPLNSFNRSSRERYHAGGQASRYDAGEQGSRADDVDNWAAGKRVWSGNYRSGSFGPMDAERWGSRRGEGFGSLDRDMNMDRERPRLVLDPPGRLRNDSLPSSPLSDAAQVDAPKPKPKANPFGSARPREEVLDKRGEVWKKLDSEIESRSSSRPTSAHSSRPQSPSLNDPPGRPRNDSLPSSLLSDAVQVDAQKPKPKPNPFGSALPREKVLAKRGEDWKKLDSEIESRSTSRPTSTHSSRPQSPSLNDSASPYTRPKVNPFGDAKPREVLLEKMGKDWRKIDFELEHRGVDRPETEEEKNLKEEVNFLRELVKKSAEDEAQVNGLALGELDMDKMASTMKELVLKEKQLERLTRELDDKVRFGKRSGDSTPGSAAGRPFEYLERPGSRSGLSDGGRSNDGKA